MGDMASPPSLSGTHVGRQRHRLRVTAALFLAAFAVYALTIATAWHTDVYGANWTSWHLAQTGEPWIDGTAIPELGDRTDYLLAIVDTANDHTAFARFPGVVVASVPAYLLLGSDSPSTVPGSLTAALLTAASVCLMFSALRRHLSDRQALLAVGVFGFATPVWTVSANLLWPHTITLLGIAGMAWAASTGRWWWAGVFGGIALWGRLHAAVIVAVFGLGVGLTRRDSRVVLRVGASSGAWLIGACAWNRWMYGTWNPLGGYGQSDMAATKDYHYDLGNQLGMWIAPDRGILVWTPVVLLLLPALVRSWGDLPDWSRSLLIGGLVYTVVQGGMMTFTGGDGFYGYRYGLELLACATPALAMSQPQVGRAARILAGPVLALQLLATLAGAVSDDAGLLVLKSEAWHQNAFVHALQMLGTAGWAMAGLFAVVGLVVSIRAWGSPPGSGSDLPAGHSRQDQLPLGPVPARVQVGDTADVG